MRLILAFRAFFLVLFNSEIAESVRKALDGETGAVKETPAETPRPIEPPRPVQPPPPARSEALTLLATLQREARFVDFIKEPLDEYEDAQIGAAARDVHRDCGKVLERLFAIRPLLDQPENATIEVPANFDATRYRLTGNVGGGKAVTGQLTHHGWQATICELPAWTGGADSALVVAPAEIEVK